MDLDERETLVQFGVGDPASAVYHRSHRQRVLFAIFSLVALLALSGAFFPHGGPPSPTTAHQLFQLQQLRVHDPPDCDARGPHAGDQQCRPAAPPRPAAGAVAPDRHGPPDAGVAPGRPPVTPAMLLVFHGATIYAPEALGPRHVVVGGTRVLEVSDPAQADSLANVLLKHKVSSSQVKLLDVTGHIITPGFIDCHAHITGGGGEKGPDSRTPAIPGSAMVRAGVTGVVGVLGTDSISRSSPDLHLKALGLKAYGLSAYMHTGSYKLPIRNSITGHVDHDIAHVEEVIGVGEICVSDYRGTLPDGFELARLATEARVAGMVTDKAGIVHAHIGGLPAGLQPLLDAVEKHGAPVYMFQPTHCGNRSPKVLEQVRKWLALGGVADFTANEAQSSGTMTSNSLTTLRSEGYNVSQMTLSSDGHGSFSRADAKGKIISYGMFEQTNLMGTLQVLLQSGWSIPEALSLCTSNPASFLSLKGKGRVEAGADADLLVWRQESLFQVEGLRHVVARGQLLKEDDWVKPDMFPSSA